MVSRPAIPAAGAVRPASGAIARKYSQLYVGRPCLNPASSGLRPSRLDVDLDRIIDAYRVNAEHVMDAAMPHAGVIAVMAEGR